MANMEVKKEIQGCCTLCYRSLTEDCSSECVLVDEGVLDLVTFLIPQLDVAVLIGSTVCGYCISKIYEVYNFKSMYVQHDSPAITNENEIKEEAILKCYICKNDVLDETVCLSIPELLEQPNIKEIVGYLIPESALQNVENSFACDLCRNGIMYFTDILTLLSVYEKHESGDFDESMDDKTFIKMEVKKETDADDEKLDCSLTHSEIKIEEAEEEPTAAENEMTWENGELPQTECNNEDIGVRMECEPVVYCNDDRKPAEGKSKAPPLGALMAMFDVVKESRCKIYKCRFCSFQSQHRALLSKHTINHSQMVIRNIDALQGSDEKLSKKNGGVLKTRLRILSNKKLNLDIQSKKLGKHNCEFCEFSCDNPFKLSLHSKIHINVFKCTACKFTTKNKSAFAAHSHSEDLKCAICELQCTSESQLKYHMENHKIPNFHCSSCDDVKKAIRESTNESTSEPPESPTSSKLLKNEDGEYKCKSCNFQTKFESILVIHNLLHSQTAEKNKHDDTKMLQCSYCTFQTKFVSQLHVHMSVHLNKKHEPFHDSHYFYNATDQEVIPLPSLYACNKCSYTTVNESILKAHTIYHDKTYNCNYCVFKTNSNALFNEHILNHYKNNKCDFCTFRCMNKNLMKIHMETHQLYKCQVCSFSSLKSTDITDHVKEHEFFQVPEDKQTFACVMCPFTTNTQTEVVTHMLSHNKQNIFNCQWCDYSTRHRLYFYKHTKGHNKSLHQCKFCSFHTFYTKSFEAHVQTHEKFTCQICSLTFLKEVDFNDHSSKGHEEIDENILKCDKCDFQTKFKSNLSIHKLLHEKQIVRAILKCSYCKFETKIPHIFTRHMRRHKDTAVFKCKLCDFETIYEPILNNHMKNLHCTRNPTQTQDYLLYLLNGMVQSGGDITLVTTPIIGKS